MKRKREKRFWTTLKNIKWNRGFLVLADIVAIIGALVFAYLTTQSWRELSSTAILWGVGNLVLALAIFGVFGLYSLFLNPLAQWKCLRFLWRRL